MTFGERLRQLREERGMSMEDVARIMGLTRPTIYRYENGTIVNVPPETVHRLANMFGVTRPYIMGWTDERHANPAENLDMVAEKLRMPFRDSLEEQKPSYWRNKGGNMPDCTTAATQAARALIKFDIGRTPIYPQQILQASKYATIITFSDPQELDDVVGMNVITSVNRNNLLMSSIYSDEEGSEAHYLFSVNRNADLGHLKLALAVEIGHIYLGHNSHMNEREHMEKEAECFAVHLEFPRAVIKLLQEKGYVFTKESFSRVFGDCEWCLDSILNARPVTISPELNRLVKEQFKPYVETLIDIGILLMPVHGEPLDLSNYMAGYED